MNYPVVNNFSTLVACFNLFADIFVKTSTRKMLKNRSKLYDLLLKGIELNVSISNMFDHFLDNEERKERKKWKVQLSRINQNWVCFLGRSSSRWCRCWIFNVRRWWWDDDAKYSHTPHTRSCCLRSIIHTSQFTGTANRDSSFILWLLLFSFSLFFLPFNSNCYRMNLWLSSIISIFSLLQLLIFLCVRLLFTFLSTQIKQQ